MAVTLFALLELYKQGEASWEQAEPFGEIMIHASAIAPARSAGKLMDELTRQIEALLFLSSDPVALMDLAKLARLTPIRCRRR